MIRRASVNCSTLIGLFLCSVLTYTYIRYCRSFAIAIKLIRLSFPNPFMFFGHVIDCLFGDTGNGSRSFSAYHAKQTIVMKTTISFNQSSKTRLANILSPWLASKNHLFSSIMSDKDEKVIVTNRQALLILQALVSGSLLLCSTFVHWFAAVVLLCWFALSVIQCKKGGLR